LATLRLVELLTLMPAAGCWKHVLVPLTQNQTCVPPVTKFVPVTEPLKGWLAVGVVFQEYAEIVGADGVGGSAGILKAAERGDCPAEVLT
jgi:hypothetical protein